MKRAVLTLMFFVLLSQGVNAQSRLNKESLRGVKRIQVLIEHIDPDVESLGVSKNRVQTDTELRLRRAGIPVTPLAVADDEGTLYINVNTMKASQVELYAFSLTVEFRQTVNLKTQPFCYA